MTGYMLLPILANSEASQLFVLRHDESTSSYIKKSFDRLKYTGIVLCNELILAIFQLVTLRNLLFLQV